MSSTKEAEDKKTEQINEAIKKLDTSSFTIHKLSVEEAIKSLGANKEQGLTQAEAEQRLLKYGPNELEKE